jgi:hypothetical protein
LNGGYRSSPHPMQPHPQTPILQCLRLLRPRWSLPPTAPPLVKRRASTRASSRSLCRVAIATGSTFATSLNRRVSCAAASPRTLTISVSPSRARSAARSAMSLRSHSVAGIIVQRMAHATSVRGGGRPASTQSRLLAGSGKRRTESAREAQGPALRRPHDPVAASEPSPKSEQVSATAKPQESTPLLGLPG